MCDRPRTQDELNNAVEELLAQHTQQFTNQNAEFVCGNHRRLKDSGMCDGIATYVVLEAVCAVCRAMIYATYNTLDVPHGAREGVVEALAEAMRGDAREGSTPPIIH